MLVDVLKYWFCLTLVGGAVASWLVRSTPPGKSRPGSSPGRGHCVVFLGFCPRVPVHKSRYKGPNNTQQLTNDS